MDRDPRLDELLGGIRAAPAGLTREDRVRMLAEVSRALLDGKTPSRAAALYVGGAIGSWLAEGGDLAKDFLKVNRRGSHLTPQRLLARLIGDEDLRADGALPSDASSTAEDSTE